MAAYSTDGENWENMLVQRLKAASLKGKDAEIASQPTHEIEEEDEHGIVWTPRARFGFRASGTFFCVRFEHCEVDGLRLHNCFFENVVFAGCSFHDVDLHNICLQDVKISDITFVNYTWTNEKLVDVEQGHDPDTPFVQGSRLGDIVPREVGGPDTENKLPEIGGPDEAAKAFQAQCDFENPWKDWTSSGAQQADATISQADHQAEQRRLWEDLAQELAHGGCTDGESAEHQDRAKQRARGNTASVSTVSHDITNPPTGAGTTLVKSLTAESSYHKLVDYSDSEDDALEEVEAKSTQSQAEAETPREAEQQKACTQHMGDDNESTLPTFVNTMTLQNGMWVSERPLMAPLSPRSKRKAAKKKNSIKPGGYLSATPTVAPTAGAVTESSARGPSLTEKERELLPSNQVSASDGSRYRVPPHVRAARKAREGAGIGSGSTTAAAASRTTASNIQVHKKTTWVNERDIRFVQRSKDFYR